MPLDARVPVTPDPTPNSSFSEPGGPREAGTSELFAPIAGMFAQVRELSGMIQHEIGAFG